MRHPLDAHGAISARSHEWRLSASIDGFLGGPGGSGRILHEADNPEGAILLASICEGDLNRDGVMISIYCFGRPVNVSDVAWNQKWSDYENCHKNGFDYDLKPHFSLYG